MFEALGYKIEDPGMPLHHCKRNSKSRQRLLSMPPIARCMCFLVSRVPLEEIIGSSYPAEPSLPDITRNADLRRKIPYPQRPDTAAKPGGAARYLMRRPQIQLAGMFFFGGRCLDIKLIPCSCMRISSVEFLLAACSPALRLCVLCVICVVHTCSSC
jgi:hypothetical protein